MKDKPPLILASAKLLEYAIADSSVEYIERKTLYVDGKLLGQVPKLAICQNYKERGLLLFHCNKEWEVLGVVYYKSIDELKKRIESEYKGINKKWIKVASPNDFKNWPSDLEPYSAKVATQMMFPLLSSVVGEIQEKDIDRGISIHQAVLSGKLEIVRKLLDVKIACVNSISHPSVDEPHRLEHWTPLIGAAAIGYNEIVQLLIDKGADVNAKDKYGTTPLMWAAVTGFTRSSETVKILLENGANVNIRNKEGKTAMDFATFANNNEIVDLLKQHGAKE